MRQLALLMAACLVIAAILSCSDSPTQPATGARVTGKVSAYFCNVGDLYNNQGVEPRYTLRTGIPAKVHFIDERGRHFDCLTDDSSNLALGMHQDTYTIIVETGHSMPDTFVDINITRDISLDLEIVYDWTLTDTIIASFFYSNSIDSLGEHRERDYLEFMQKKLNDMVNARSARRIVYLYEYEPNWVSINYYVPIRRGMYMWRVVEAASKITEEYKDHFPEHFRFQPTGYICLD